MDPNFLALLETEENAFQPSLLAQPVSSVSPTGWRTPAQSQGAPNRLSVDILRGSGRGSSSENNERLPKGTVRAASRGTYTTNVGLRVPSDVPSSFKALSFNILAQRYASSDKYPDCPPLALTEAYRAPFLASEIKTINADIIALQEVSNEMYSRPGHLGDMLRDDGYEGVHAIITDNQGNDLSRADCGVSEAGSDMNAGRERQDVEGLAIMFRPTRFEPLRGFPHQRYCLCETPAKDDSLTPAEKKKLLIGSHNVALCYPLRCRVTRRCFLFVTIHAYWDTSRPEAQVYQLDQLLKCVHETRKSLEAVEGTGNVCVVLLGDFNCELAMSPMQYLMHGSLDLTATGVIPISSWTSSGQSSIFSPVVTHTLGRRAGQRIELRHPFRFECAYSEYWRREEHTNHVTAVNPSQGFRGCAVDHIFLEKGMLSVLDCAKVSTKRNHFGEYIPNDSYPSDHYPVAATLIPTRVLKDLAAANDGSVLDAEALGQALEEDSRDSEKHHRSQEDDAQPSWFLLAEKSLLKNGDGSHTSDPSLSFSRGFHSPSQCL